MDINLGPLGDLGNTSVVGLQWGDEGKGKIVDLLAGSYDVAVRWNGGSNAGHSVHIGGKKYALHLIPVSVLRGGCTSVIANGVALDPIKLLEEVDQLATQGVEIGENLKISSAAHVVLPYHKLQDQLSETRLGSAKIGTTARGIGPCYADKANRSAAIRVADLLDDGRLRDKLQRAVEEKNKVLAALYSAEPLQWQGIFEQYRSCGEQLRPHVCNSVEYLHTAWRAGKKLLFEGANAVLLDLDQGTFPFVTSSNCGTGLSVGTGLPAQAVRSVLGVVKAYSTRVGSGPFPTEQDNAIGEKIRQRGNEFGTTTGRPRRCGHLDLVALSYAAKVAGATGLCVTLLDVLSTFSSLQLCTAYEVRGKTTSWFDPDATELAAATPVYETLPGWHETLGHARAYEQLPDAARRYLDRIQQFVELPIRIVGVGPGRDQTLVL